MRQCFLIIAICIFIQCAFGEKKIIFDSFKVKVDGNTHITKSLTFPEKIEKFTISNMDTLEVETKIIEADSKKSITGLEQAMMYLTNEEKSYTYIMESKENGKYINNIKNISVENGVYSLLVRFSSPVNDYTPLLYTFGKIEVANTQVEQPVDPNKAPSIMESEGKNFYPKPDQPHIFKAETKKPNTFLAKIFTVLVLAPWIYLIIIWKKIGVNVKGLFKTKTTTIYGFLFMISLLSVLFVLVMYFVKLNIFQTLKYLGITGALTAVFGHLVLCNKALNRLNSRKSKNEKKSKINELNNNKENENEKKNE